MRSNPFTWAGNVTALYRSELDEAKGVTSDYPLFSKYLYTSLLHIDLSLSKSTSWIKVRTLKDSSYFLLKAIRLLPGVPISPSGSSPGQSEDPKAFLCRQNAGLRRLKEMMCVESRACQHSKPETETYQEATNISSTLNPIFNFKTDLKRNL